MKGRYKTSLNIGRPGLSKGPDENEQESLKAIGRLGAGIMPCNFKIMCEFLLELQILTRFAFRVSSRELLVN